MKIKKILITLALTLTITSINPITSKAFSDDPLSINYTELNLKYYNDYGVRNEVDRLTYINRSYYGYYFHKQKKIAFKIYNRETNKYDTFFFYCKVKNFKKDCYVKVSFNKNGKIKKVVRSNEAKQHTPTKKIKK